MAEVAPEGLVVQGTGEAASKGMRKGAVIDIERAAEAVAEAVDAAERMAGVEVSQVIVGLAGIHIASQPGRGLVAVGADPKRSREVRPQDVTRAVEAARAVGVPSDREIVHLLPRHFTVDGQDGVRDALGMTGMRLEVEALIITGAITAIQNVVKVVHEAGLDCEDLVLQALASAEAVLSEEELERGVVVADVGGGTTDVAVFCRRQHRPHRGDPGRRQPRHRRPRRGPAQRPGDRRDHQAPVRHCLQLTLPADATVTMTPMGYEEPVEVPQRYLAEVIGPRPGRWRPSCSPSSSARLTGLARRRASCSPAVAPSSAASPRSPSRSPTCRCGWRRPPAPRGWTRTCVVLTTRPWWGC